MPDAAEELPPLDSQALRFDLSQETRRTVVDLIRGSRPSTILGVLIHSKDGVTVDVIAKELGESVGLVGWNIDKLESEDLCIRVSMDGETKVFPCAGYTERNT
jgi:hypothetical protein